MGTEKKIQIAGMQKSSMVDYPGMVSIAVFTPKCNYDCFYCHNREILNSQGTIEVDEVLDFARRRAKLIEGFVISGGEPTLQPGLIDFIKEIKALGYNVKLDTNGSNLDVVKHVIEKKLIDYIAVDLKAPFKKYKEICRGNADGDIVKQTIMYVRDSRIPYEIRTTLIPQLTSQEMLEAVIELSPLRRYGVQQYRKPSVLRECDRFKANVQPHSNEYLQNFATECTKYCDEVVIKI